MFEGIANLIKFAKGKFSVAEALQLIDEHSDAIDPILVSVLNNHYDKAKRVLGKLTPTTRQRMVLLLQESEVKPGATYPGYIPASKL